MAKWLRRPTVNRKIPSSTLGGEVSFCLFFFPASVKGPPRDSSRISPFHTYLKQMDGRGQDLDKETKVLVPGIAVLLTNAI